MFLHLSVILFRGGVCHTPHRADTPIQCMLGYTHPLPSAGWDTHPPAQCRLGYTHPLPSAGWDTPPCPVHAGIHIPLPSAWWDTQTPLPSACWDTPPALCMMGYTPCPVHAGIHPHPVHAGIRSSGRYASHWNAFLFFLTSVVTLEIKF